MTLVLSVLMLVLSLVGPGDDIARRANDAYDAGDYATAEELYLEALAADGNNPKILFNLGSTLARQGKADEALGVFNQYKSVVDDPSDKAKADYNIGKMFADANDLDKALQQFRDALRKNPLDDEAKYNYELAYKRKQEQDQQQQQQQQDQQNQEQNQDQQQQQQDQQQQNQDQRNQDQNQDQQQQQQQDQQDQQQQQQQQQQTNMTQEEAEKILKALANKEKDEIKNQFKKKRAKSPKKNAKDW